MALMSNVRLAKIILSLLFIIAIIIPLFYINHLPARVASHFDFNNQADSWMSKTGYLFFHYGIIFFFYMVFWGLSIVIPKFPTSMINIPHKNYWLHEVRKTITIATIQAMLLWIGNVCLALFIYIFYEILNANVTGSQHISSFSWVSVILFLVATTLIVIKYIMFFTQKENQLD